MKIRDRVKEFRRVPAGELMPNPKNWRQHPEAQANAMRGVLAELGLAGVALARETENGLMLLDGHLRAEIVGDDTPIPVVVLDLTPEEGDYLLATYDPLTGLAGADAALLRELLETVETSNPEVDEMLQELLREAEGLGGELDPRQGVKPEAGRSVLREKFLIPPFSVLDVRAGYWQERKRAWLALGMESGGSREEMKVSGSISGTDPQFYYRKTAVEKQLGRKLSSREFIEKYFVPSNVHTRYTDSGSLLSLFDPVLAELAYRWFCPPAGRILDPFAGGSVRGVVAGRLGYHYEGIDLRPEQCEANRENWAAIQAANPPMQRLAPAADNMPDVTPVERRGKYWVKREDVFAVAGVCGGKVRTCRALAQGATGLVTAGSRMSPQVNIVAHIAAALGVPCRVHTPTGELSPEVEAARGVGAEVVQHEAGYNAVICARAREDAEARGWRLIPFGMECEEAVTQTRRQVANLPEGISRLVVPVGSGMSLAGILWGLKDAGREIPILGVRVGADPSGRLDKFAPADWRQSVDLVTSELDYHDPAPETNLEGLDLDPIYEAKCLPYLLPRDCLWVVGIRQTARVESIEGIDPEWTAGDSAEVLAHAGDPVDFVFSCPPYADLEQYSEDPADLSNMPYDEFLAAYRDIIAKACGRLRENRFACFVVGDIREKSGGGAYRNFVSDTIAAFLDAGLRLYNEAVLVTPVAAVSMRVAKPFEKSRKLGKCHQNVLVFVKGDPLVATETVGPVQYGNLTAETAQEEPDAAQAE